MSRLAKEAAKFDNVEVPPDQRRQLNVLKLSLVLATPSDPKEAEELTKILARMDAMYGKGKCCGNPAKPDDCLNIDDITKIMAESRNETRAAARLGRLAHHLAADAEGLRAVRRAVEQGREGAGLRRHRRDVAGEVRHAAGRLHQGARPALGSGAAALSRAARLRARRSCTRSTATRCRPTVRLPAHLLGNIWAQDWSNVYSLVAPAVVRCGLLAHRHPEAAQDRARSTWCAPASASTRRSASSRCRRRSGSGRCSSGRRTARSSATPARGTSICESDVRIKMCIEQTAEDFTTIHHELGHNFYQRAYKDQPVHLPRQRQRRIPRSDRRHDRAVGHARVPGARSGCSTRRRTPRATSAC